MKLRSTIIKVLSALVVLGAVAFVSYRMGARQSSRELAAMQDEMDRFAEAEKDAAIVKRVSQQMEDIAYQQKAISDQQRDRAEEQSILATQNAARAELESRAAREAQFKANAAAEVAEKERANAERQQVIALEQRDEATYARNVADTLNRRTQGKSLAVSSQVRRESGEPEVADLLAYASWYFLKENRGNQYFSDSFKALNLATDGLPRYKVKENGAVNAIARIPGSKGQCVSVTNYGEVEWLSASTDSGPKKITSTSLLFNPAYDFRDVKVIDGSIYALSLKGPLCIIDFKGNLTTVDLPEDDYFRLLQDNDCLLVAGRRSICRYAEGKVTGIASFDKPLSAVVEREGAICLFFSDRSFAEMDAAGKVTAKTPLVNSMVTAAWYDKASKCLLLGLEDGSVYPVNKFNRVLETMAAHKAKCASIVMQGPNVVTGGYDKKAFIWNMDNMVFESGLSFDEEMELATVGKRVANKKQIPAEWLVPVDYSLDGWVLSVCSDSDGKSVWLGTSSGSVTILNSSADDMAYQLYDKLNRNLTQQEWSRYVGASIPYILFK